MRKQNKVNVDWNTHEAPNFTWEQVGVEVLMDIRGELQKLNALLHCVNFVRIPQELTRIRLNTTKKSRKAKP